MIITSPYIRCVQTAVAVSEVLPSKKGTQVPLLIDTEVSEALSWILITCSGYWIALLGSPGRWESTKSHLVLQIQGRWA